MRFSVLGPLTAAEDGRELALGVGRQRALLLLLVLHHDQVISIERLIDELWAGAPPSSAAKVVQGYVSRLRRALPAGTIVTREPGYALVGADTDAAEFERLVERARGEPPTSAAATLKAALGLWRGTPFAEVEYESRAQTEIACIDPAGRRMLSPSTSRAAGSWWRRLRSSLIRPCSGCSS